MKYVPVLSKTGKPLMPCHAARARELVRKGRAVRRFRKGLFYIQLLDRGDGKVQDIAVGIDPGSKKEGFSVKSYRHTYLNIQADSVTWVSDVVKTRRQMRRARRYRNCPYRKPKPNRKGRGIPPSTRARWGWKLRICRWLAKLYPIHCFVVEDVKATKKKGQRKWNASFSPLETGKRWFYEELGKIAPIMIKGGFETKQLRENLGLKKTKNKKAEIFDAHAVDAWVLANSWVGGHTEPDNKTLLCISPLRFHRRQLHRIQPSRGGVRHSYGGTYTQGLKRGSLIKHQRYGIVYVGGTTGGRVYLMDLGTGKKLGTVARLNAGSFLCYNSWRWYVGEC